MGVVTWMVETTDNFLDDAAQTTFGNVAGQLGSVIVVASTLAVIGTKGSRARARFGTRSNAEIAGAGIRQAGGATVSMVQRMADRAKRLE